ncbi:restriction endonuclease subunit S [Phocaeicola dorei]|uniref:restriction endonuclease subunit S n=1 Tax=Phocaeicola dorei TaxID=357276 RepID=UPI00397C45CD
MVNEKKEGASCITTHLLFPSDTPHYPYLLPNGWEWCNLEDIVCELKYGTSEKSLSVGKIAVLRMGNITNVGTIDYSNLVYSSNNEDIKLYSLEKDDLLFNRTNSSEWVGKTAIYKKEQPAIYAGYLIRIRPILIFSDYLNTVMNSSYYRNWCYNVKTDAVNQSNINAQKLSQLMIPIPPLKEQERIVVEVAKWISLIDTIKNSKEDLQTTIKQAKSKILNLAIHGKLVPQDPNDEPAIELLKRINPDFTPCDNGHYPVGWIETILGELFSHNTGKALNSSNKEGIFKDYLTTSNVYWNKFDFTAIKQMPFKESELNKCTVTKGDLLVCEGGDIGRSAIWNYDYDICIQNHIHRLRPKIDLCVPFYYYTFAYLKENNLIGGKGIGLLGLSSNALHKIEMPLPPLAEQQRIVQKIEELFSVLDNIQNALEV